MGGWGGSSNLSDIQKCASTAGNEAEAGGEAGSEVGTRIKTRSEDLPLL